MKPLNRALLIGALVALSSDPSEGFGQWNKKPYTEWSEKESMKLLNDSPWAQTQTVTDTSNMTGQGRADSSQSRVAEVFNVNIRIRFLSAKPVRQAISHVMEMNNREKISAELAARLKAFAAADFPDYIVVTVSADSDKSSRLLQQTQQVFYKLTTGELKNNTYLLASGRRVFINEYQPPGSDGLGARYIFPRLVDGKAFITPESGEVLFHSEPIGAVVLNTRYKVKDMMFEGKLEY
ncbi:MAG TPA: hypothetical protein VLM38_11900 [Blastocatellia bacterium]|nr:hypothetical protein [Blastocatellia bacterium]